MIEFYGQSDPWYELTNFYRCKVPVMLKVGGYEVRSHYSECLYQAVKVWFVEGLSENFCRVLEMEPRGAFDYVHGLDREWTRDEATRRRVGEFHEMKVRIMEVVVKAKMVDDERVALVLLQTGEARLVEASPVDSFWGAGRDGKGKNQLGEILMRVREQLRRGDYGVSAIV